LFGFLRPEPEHDRRRTRRDLRLLALDHVFSQSMVALVSGAFMVALVLALGGDNKVIGLIAAIGPLTQAVQIPAIFLVQSLRRRRAITVITAWLARLLFLVVAAIPWVLPEGVQIPALLVTILVHCLLANVSGCAYGSWVRDVIPERVMGRHMGGRLAAAIGAGAVISLLAGLGAGLGWTREVLGEVLPYSIIFGVAGVLGMIGTAQLMGVQEPAMPRTESASPLALIQRPLRDRGFRAVLVFMGCWAFAQNLALPFFAVYMFDRLGLSISVVVGLSVLTQLVNVALFPIWGGLADRFSNKAVIAASGLLMVFSFLLWPLMTLGTMPVENGAAVVEAGDVVVEAVGARPDGFYWATWPLLIAAHVVLGVGTAGVALAAGNLALKAAPRGEATAFLATNALITGMGAAVAPILAGFLGDYFDQRILQISLSWLDPTLTEPLSMPAFDLRGLDFLFVIAFVFGLYALHRLAAIEERGEVSETAVLYELRLALRRSVFSVGGATRMMSLPTGTAIRTARRITRRLRREERAQGPASRI
jgi:MFS family permease